jgi:hypothetical protein
MKICDRCGTKDDNSHNAVGPVVTRVEGYHYNHWSHRNKKQTWSIDLCPKCAEKLKDELEKLFKSFPGSSVDRG